MNWPVRVLIGFAWVNAAGSFLAAWTLAAGLMDGDTTTIGVSLAVILLGAANAWWIEKRVDSLRGPWGYRS